MVAAAALPLAGCGGDGRTLGSGDVVRVLDDPAVTRLAQEPDLTARLPVGELGLGWSDDPDLLASVTDDEGRALTASGDATLIAVSWDLDPTATEVEGPPGLAVVAGAVDHALALVSGGERTVLVPRSERALRGSAVAAVTDPADLALEVTFDGVTQVVGPGAEVRQLPGRVQPLYEGLPGAAATIDCRPAAAEAFCRADATWLPWVVDRGWAPEGQLWPVVRVEARLADDVEATLEADLGGTPPLSSEDLGGNSVNQLLVFPAAEALPAELTVQVRGPGATVNGRARLSPQPPTDR